MHNPRSHGLLLTMALLLGAGTSLAAGDGLEALVATKSAALARFHDKAAGALVTAAQDDAFVALLRSAGGDGHEHHRHRVEAVSLAVQRKFDVAEMCLITAGGAELARIVGAEVADDLSPDETGAPFFSPALHTAPRAVHVSDPYVSADVHRWVVAYVTPLAHDGETLGLLHYEHEMDGYRELLVAGNRPAGTRLVVVDRHGRLVLDSADPAFPPPPAGDDGELPVFSVGALALDAVLAAADRAEPVTDAAGRRLLVRYQRVRDWLVIGLEEGA